MSDELTRQLAGTGAALLAGGLTKWLSKRKGKTVHQIGSPVAAVLGGLAASFATGEGAITLETAIHGVQFGMQAVFGQSVVHGAVKASGRF